MYSLFVEGKVEKKQHVGGANEDVILECRISYVIAGRVVGRK